MVQPTHILPDTLTTQPVDLAKPETLGDCFKCMLYGVTKFVVICYAVIPETPVSRPHRHQTQEEQLGFTTVLYFKSSTESGMQIKIHLRKIKSVA